MRYTPNTVYPFQKTNFGKRVVFWKILSEKYDSPDGRLDPEDSAFKYIPTNFNKVDDELWNTVQRYLDLGYCPAIDIDLQSSASGVICVMHDKWLEDLEDYL